jgi:hypothetical protein
MPGNPDEEMRLLERRKKAAHLRVVVGLQWDEVAEMVGYTSGPVASNDVNRYLKRLRKETDHELEGLQQQQDLRYDALRKKAYAIMMSSHPLVQGGKIVMSTDGVTPLQDVGPQLAALQTLLRIEKQWAELHGTEASKKLEIALEGRADLESNLVAEAVLAAAQVLNLDPAQRMLALEAAAARLEVVDGEVISDEPG